MSEVTELIEAKMLLLGLTVLTEVAGLAVAKVFVVPVLVRSSVISSSKH